MEIKQELKVRNDILDRINQGYNFLNVDKQGKEKEKKYYINVFIETKQNLKEKTEKMKIKQNLFSVGYWDNDFNVNNFLEKLDKFSKKLFCIIKKTSNRKNKSNYDTDLSELRDKFRDKTIVFNDIDINITENAEQQLKYINLDFIGEVKKLLNQQQKTDKSKQKLIDRFVYLKEKVLTLKTFIEKTNSYDSRKKEDNSLKILITPEEYNQKLKEIETEMKTIAESFGIELRELDYIVIKERIGFDEWFKQNEDELKENYEENEGESDFENFDEYAEQMYVEFEGYEE